MILAIDIGNTNIVLSCIDNDKILFISRVVTDILKTEDQYAIELKNILEIYNIDKLDIQGSIISSVVPQLTNILKIATYKVINKTSIIVNTEIELGIGIVVDDIKAVGTDRIVNCVAAVNLYNPSVIIVDMGTATTISVVDKDGNYIGGCITAGVKTSLEALSLKASKLPYIDIDTPKKVIGTNTIECMLSGIINGNAAMVDGMIERIENELGYSTTVIATGGISKFVVPHCKHQIKYNENLILEGLNIIYKKNNVQIR